MNATIHWNASPSHAMRGGGYLHFICGFLAFLALASAGSAVVGRILGPRLIHPMNMNPARIRETEEMLERVGAAKEDFLVRAPDGIELRGWKIRAECRMETGYSYFTAYRITAPASWAMPSFCCATITTFY